MTLLTKTEWTSPSNIAIVKYWGKTGVQIPMNPSFSFSLSSSSTTTKILWEPNSKGDTYGLSFLYEGAPKPAFEPKIKSFLDLLKIHVPWLKDWNLHIDSSNSFPHSAGIASSASSMSALALGIVSMEKNIQGRDLSQMEFLRRASFLARLGSGSACRSVYPYASLWGLTPDEPDSSDEFAIPMESSIHALFRTLHDYVILVNKSEKSVSSSAGHSLMNNHPYRTARIAQATDNLHKLLTIVRTGDWDAFTEISEEEALSLHGLMMSSKPGYLLLEPESVRIIHSIQDLRKNISLPICFTIDAGPNIHVLFPESSKAAVDNWISSELLAYNPKLAILKDHIGKGPQEVL